VEVVTGAVLVEVGSGLYHLFWGIKNFGRSRAETNCASCVSPEVIPYLLNLLIF
jgi:hypothetical protein